jgi:hypothetical protein
VRALPHLVVSAPEFMYSFPESELMRQHWHMDRAWERGVVCVIFSMAEGTRCCYKQDDGTKVTLTLDKGDIVCFHGNLVHAGSNARGFFTATAY